MRGAGTHICVELPHKAGEVVVLEELAQQLSREVLVLPDREAASTTHSLAATSYLHLPLRGGCDINLRDPA
jgi:hypothetical protein